MMIIKHKGLLFAAVLFLCWSGSLLALMHYKLSAMPFWSVGLCIVIRTVLQTGLFITAHDAMHGLLVPHKRNWNHRLGALALAFYAALPYESSLSKHRRHHRLTASRQDPDFSASFNTNGLGWYLKFMASYFSYRQLARLLTAWSLLVGLSSAINASAALNVLVFCIVPLCLSSIQLFVFGTYLPHRNQRTPINNHDPDSLALPPWLSLLTCFHFSYHREHHDYPGLAWYELPAQRRLSQKLAPTQ